MISTKKNNNHKSKHDKIPANLFRLNRSADLLLYLLKLPDEKSKKLIDHKKPLVNTNRENFGGPDDFSGLYLAHFINY